MQDVYKAQLIAEKQIDKMCSYLAFKKRYSRLRVRMCGQYT